MAADISALGQLQPVEPLDMDCYPESKGFKPLAPAGTYLLQAPDAFPPFSDGAVNQFGRTQAGALSARIDPKIAEGEFTGTELKFTKVSAKQYKKDGKVASQMGNYLHACGISGKLNDEQAMADAIEQTANLTFRANLDWRAYNSKTKFSVDGMERFPSDGNGGHIPYYDDPTEKQVDDQGNPILDAKGQPKPVRLRAQLQIKGFVPQASV